MRILTAIVPFLLLSPAFGQRQLQAHTLPQLWTVQKMRSAGDVNGDGHLDVVAIVHDNTPSASPFAKLMVFSGLTGLPLYTIADQALLNAFDVLGIGDVNTDGRSDIVALTPIGQRLYSGANGAFLNAAVPPANTSFVSGTGVGDYNGNGTADLAIASHFSGNTTVRIVRGENGAQLATLATFPNPNTAATVRAMGDVNGDGKSEVAISIPTGTVTVMHGATGATLWSIAATGNDNNRTIDTLDLEGDGKRELFFLRPDYSSSGANSLLTVHAATNGAVMITVPGIVNGGLGRTIAGIGNVDDDNRTDFAILTFLQGVRSVRAVSGANTRRLWVLPSWTSGGPKDPVVSVGDVDADGYGDFFVGASNWPLADNDSLHLISGKVIAESQPQAGACGGGPFFPRLGVTRPILGQTVTIAGQDGPIGVPGLLTISVQPAAPTWLGASSCYAFTNITLLSVLATLSQPQWNLPLTLPLVPQLAGFEIALQSYYAPTIGPLGFDLSNGVWARLGYQ
ncbi:MAG TPA: FG-GAP-like repeat-containing protein [Planctomycetota bacterium]